ncbi:TetR/AcrR family transcriptional regulator [Thalassospira sp.]|uniref:TetR/AcrR family transcriptional regulator n=1 Tax=Thalassospira sp. TaxID=1912094 RepID=UPI0027336527|nr:TetR/AcrR family transcriptional regulator [Thalassospira sp.]MDP2696714.1 TetR/AcrR family transcriptional regulator [Thalassospira sp.]
MRSEKRQHREEAILDKTQDLIAEFGFFELKMSDLARACDIAVGTLYAHFASKEDLLIGLASRAVMRRTAFFETARAHDGPAIEKFIVASLLDVRFSIRHPELFEAEYLALAPSIWNRATVARHQQLLAQIDQMTRMFQAFLEEAAQDTDHTDQGGTAPDRTGILNIGSWALGFGMNALGQSDVTVAHYGTMLRDRSEQTYCDCLTDLLIGAGMAGDAARQSVARIAARYLDV